MAMYRNISIIIGCSNLGAAIATELSLDGEYVLIIDNNEDSFDKISDSFSGNTICADATDINVLDENELMNAKLVVIATNNENTNIFLAHVIAELYHAKKVIVRLNTLDKKELLDDINVEPIFPFSLSLDEFNNIMKEEANQQ